ncbi:MAG: translation initiation factor IF-3, partial [Algoriella sp.]
MAIRRKGGRGPARVIKEDQHKINDKIDAKEVRVVGEGIEPGVYSISKALELAQEQNLDLVMISEKAIPPVCRVVEYKKFL